MKKKRIIVNRINIIFILLIIPFGKVYSIKVDTIKKGTEITCPKDNKPVLTIIDDISEYSDLTLKYFKFKKYIPLYLRNKIPCEAIKEFCFHTAEGWVGFDDKCILIPDKSGISYKEYLLKQKDLKIHREYLMSLSYKCEVYNEKLGIEICISDDSLWRCLKGNIYKNDNKFGPCEKNKKD